MELCAWMRWKCSRVAPRDPEVLAEMFARNEVPYSCLKTCMPWGPDDQPAVPELCDSRRACFEAAWLRPVS